MCKPGSEGQWEDTGGDTGKDWLRGIHQGPGLQHLKARPLDEIDGSYWLVIM